MSDLEGEARGGPRGLARRALSLKRERAPISLTERVNWGQTSDPNSQMSPRILQVSSANTAFQRLEVIQRNRTKRHRYGEFLVEGVRAINGALAAEWNVRAFAYARG